MSSAPSPPDPADEHVALTGADVLRPVAHLLAAELDGQVVVLDRATAMCHALNPSAGLVLDSLDGHRSLDEVVGLLHRETGVDVGQLAAGVMVAAEQFQQSGLAVLAADADPVAAPPPSTLVPIDPDAPRSRWSGPLAAAADRRARFEVGPVRLGASSVVVRTDDEQVADRLEALLASLARAGAAATVVHVLDRGERRGARRWWVRADAGLGGEVADREGAIELVLQVLNQLAVHGSVGGLLFHAGAVERDGRAVVIAGLSGRGKSTLTAALVQAGLGYLTDEMVHLDPTDMTVTPYPKALDLSAASQELLGLAPAPAIAGKAPVPPGGLGRVSDGGRVALLVLLGDRHDTGASSEGAGEAADLRPLDPVEALVALLPSTFAETFARPDGLERLADLCATTPAVLLERGSIDEAVRRVISALDGPPPS